MNTILEPHLTECVRCPNWQIACATEAEKQRREERHAHHKHGDPLPPQPVAAGDWQAQAVDAVTQVAARGQDFRIFDALAEFGLADPPDAQHRLGRFTTLIHDLGIAHKVSDAPSTRPGTNKSAAGVWNRDGRRCVDLRHRQKAGAAR